MQGGQFIATLRLAKMIYSKACALGHSSVFHQLQICLPIGLIIPLITHGRISNYQLSVTTYAFGGYIKADLIFSDYGGGSVAAGSAGRDFYIPSTVPIGSNGQICLDLHSKESRIQFRSDHHLDNGTNLATYLEMDFLLAGHGDERVSNSYNPHLGHAFLTYDKWLFGQTWTTLFNVGALPENLDFIGPSEATIFGRQVMIRYIGLNTVNGAVLDQDGNLHSIESSGIFGSYRHFWNEKWRSNLTLAYLRWITISRYPEWR